MHCEMNVRPEQVADTVNSRVVGCRIRPKFENWVFLYNLKCGSHLVEVQVSFLHFLSSTSAIGIINNLDETFLSEIFFIRRLEAVSLRCAENGDLDMLKFARENGCPWDEKTCMLAAENDNLDVLKWARENGGPWDESKCTFAAASCRLKILQ